MYLSNYMHEKCTNLVPVAKYPGSGSPPIGTICVCVPILSNLVYGPANIHMLVWLNRRFIFFGRHGQLIQLLRGFWTRPWVSVCMKTDTFVITSLPIVKCVHQFAALIECSHPTFIKLDNERFIFSGVRGGGGDFPGIAQTRLEKK